MVEDMSRYRSLCAAVLYRAILDLKRFKMPRGRIVHGYDDAGATVSAVRWIFGEGEFMLGFEDCCDAVDQDRNAIRKKAMEIILIDKGVSMSDFNKILGTKQ